MQYAILVYETEHDFAARSDGEKKGDYWGAYQAYSGYLGERCTGGNLLAEPDTATTIRLRDGERLVEDGPFADTKERLGGLFVVEAASLDEAMEMAAKCPSAATGSVEIRPIPAMGG